MGHGNRHGNHGGGGNLDARFDQVANSFGVSPQDLAAWNAYRNQYNARVAAANNNRDANGGVVAIGAMGRPPGLSPEGERRLMAAQQYLSDTGGRGGNPSRSDIDRTLNMYSQQGGYMGRPWGTGGNAVTPSIDPTLRNPQANAEGLGSGTVNPTGGGADNAPPPAYYPPRPPVGGGGVSLGPGNFGQDTNPTPFSPPPMRYPPVRGGSTMSPWAAAVTGMTNGVGQPPSGGVGSGPIPLGPGDGVHLGPGGQLLPGLGGGGYEPPGSGNGFGQSNGASGGGKVLPMQTPMLGPPPTAPAPGSGKVVGGGVSLGPVAPTPFGTGSTPTLGASNPGSTSPGSYTPPKKVVPTHQWGTIPYAAGGPSGAPPGSGNGYGQGAGRMPQLAVPPRPTAATPTLGTQNKGFRGVGGGGFTVDPYFRGNR